jgi:hypothetical protein
MQFINHPLVKLKRSQNSLGIPGNRLPGANAMEIESPFNNFVTLYNIVTHNVLRILLSRATRVQNNSPLHRNKVYHICTGFRQHLHRLAMDFQKHQ